MHCLLAERRFMKKAAYLVLESIQSHLIGDDSPTSTWVGICTEKDLKWFSQRQLHGLRKQSCMCKDLKNDLQQNCYSQTLGHFQNWRLSVIRMLSFSNDIILFNN